MKFIYSIRYYLVLGLLLGFESSSYAATFPSQHEMQNRLMQVESDSKLRAEFFPLLYAYANQNKTPDEITSIFLDAIDQFSKKQKSSGMIKAQLVPRSFVYIR